MGRYLRSGGLTYTHAGHNPPVLIPLQGEPRYFPRTRQLVIGAMESLPYQAESMWMARGDRLLLDTDGVTEAMNLQDELYAEERLLAGSSELQHEPIVGIVKGTVASIKALAGTALQSDDITTMTIEYLRPEFSTPGQLQTALGSGVTRDDGEFFSMLHRVGILLDADTPDPVHAMMPNHAVMRSLLLYPTNACNLRCVYCHATSGPNAGPKLSRDHACAAIDHFFHSLDPQVRAVVLRFHGGGEPTTNFPVMAAAWAHFSQHAAKRNLAASAQTITNGVFGKEVLHALQAPHWHVTVSYDFLSACTEVCDGRLVPDIGWQPMTAELKASCSAHPGAAGRLVALVPPFARARWNQDVNRRPFFPVDKNARRFFHLPPRAD